MAQARPESAATAEIIALEQRGERALSKSPNRSRGRGKTSLIGSIATHAVLIVTSIVLLFPLVWVISASFKPNQDIESSLIQLIPAHATLQNYINVITDPQQRYPFLTWAGNSAGVALLTMLVGVAIALPAAYAISRFEFLGRQGVLLSFLITQMFPGALLLVPLFRLFTEFGLLGKPYALVIAYATTSLPFSVYLMKNFFDAVPRELDQAGLVDGLGPFGVFWRIIAPLTLPGIAVVAFFNFMNAWNEFMLARAFLTDNTSLTLPVGLQSWVFQFSVDWGSLTAASILVTIPVFILFVWAQRYLIAGLTGGSVKG
jgi:arabinogalactan oligomer / maltooligosaccharide transport system permease protein